MASGSWCSVPGLHFKVMSCSINLRAQRWYFGVRDWLLKRQVNAEQSVMSVNGRPQRQGWKSLTAHMTARHSRSVADLSESPLDHLLLPYAITSPTPSMHCVSTAPAPVLLASVDSENGSVHTGRARIGGDVKASLCASKALFCFSHNGTFFFFALLVLNLGSLSKSKMDATTVLYWGTICRKYPVMPSNIRTSSTVFGLDSCVIASILLRAGLVPSLSKIMPTNSMTD